MEPVAAGLLNVGLDKVGVDSVGVDSVGLVSVVLFKAGERLGALVSSANEFGFSEAGVKDGSDGSASGLKPPALLLAPSYSDGLCPNCIEADCA